VESADGLGDLGAQLVGEHDERDRLERRKGRAALAVAQPGTEIDGPGQQQHAQPAPGALGHGVLRGGPGEVGGQGVRSAEHPCAFRRS
jgi:hypothetical protein